MNNRNNYEILERILIENNIPERNGNGKRWIAPDPEHPEQGEWVTSDSEWEEVSRSNDAIEKFLRS